MNDLEDEMGIEPDVVDRRDEGIQESGPQINESIGSDKSSGDGGFPL